MVGRVFLFWLCNTKRSEISHIFKTLFFLNKGHTRKVLRFKKHSSNLGDLIHERQFLINFIAAAVSLTFDILRHLALHSANCNRHTFNQQLLVRLFFISVPFANISPSIATWAMKRNQLSIWADNQLFVNCVQPRLNCKERLRLLCRAFLTETVEEQFPWNVCLIFFSKFENSKFRN